MLDAAMTELRAGGAEGDAFMEERRTLDLSIRDGQITDLARAEVRGLAVRAMKNGRLGFTHTTALTLEGAAAAAKRATALSDAASPREDLLLANPATASAQNGWDEATDLGLYDPDLEVMDIEQKAEWARAAETAARAVDPRIRRTDSANYQEQLSRRWIVNTRGLFRYYRKSNLGGGVGIVLEDNGEMQPGGRAVQVNRWRDLPTPSTLGREAGERAVQMFGGRPVPSGRYPVIWHPDAGFALLLYVTTALNGDALSRKQSWLANRDTPRLGSDLVTIRDEPRRSDAPASAPFDGEGTDTVNSVLVDNGMLRGRLLDLASGMRLGATSTGHSTRGGYETLPGIGPSNLFLQPGNKTPEQLMYGVEKGLWVWKLTGWWIGMNASSSQFSSAAAGMWIENGKPTRPVARVTIAGALDEVLGAVDGVGNDFSWEGAVRTPSFRVREMAIAGE